MIIRNFATVSFAIVMATVSAHANDVTSTSNGQNNLLDITISGQTNDVTTNQQGDDNSITSQINGDSNLVNIWKSAKKNAHEKTPNEISVSSDVDEISSMFMVIYS